MESPKKYNPQKRKPIRGKLDHSEIRDNVKNDAIIAKSRFHRSSSQSESDSDPEIYDSEEEEYEEEYINHRRLSDESPNTTYVVRNGPRRRHREPTPFELENKSSTLTENKTLSPKLSPIRIQESATIKQQNQSPDLLIYVILMVSFIGLVYYLNTTFLTGNSEETKSKINSVESRLHDVKETLTSIKSRYKNQDKNLWKSAYIGISELLRRPQKPSIIILLGEKSDPIDCLATLLGNVSSNALNSNRLRLTPNEFHHDVGEVIEDLRAKIKKNKAIIVWDLLNINVEALKAFHNLCDRINPLVEEVIYIITVIAEKIDKEIDPLDFVERELKKKLSGKMKEDAIQPLITRITDGPILTINPEPTVLDCPLPKA